MFDGVKQNSKNAVERSPGFRYNNIAANYCRGESQWSRHMIPQVSVKYYRKFPNQKILCLRMKEIGILGAIRFDIITRPREGSRAIIVRDGMILLSIFSRHQSLCHRKRRKKEALICGSLPHCRSISGLDEKNKMASCRLSVSLQDAIWYSFLWTICLTYFLIPLICIKVNRASPDFILEHFHGCT